MKQDPTKFDTKEFTLPDTVYSRDIDNKVFQGIIIKALSEIADIGLIEGNVLDTLIGRAERIKGISTEQDPKSHAIKIKIELNIRYGVSIPQKAEEIQSRVAEAITHLTGLRVSEIHIVFKELLTTTDSKEKKILAQKKVKTPEDIESARTTDFEESDF